MPNQVTVGVRWLHDHLLDDDVIVLDGSWHLPPENRNPRAEYEEEHIPGSLFFDLDKHSRQDTNLPHMMPTAEQFGKEMGELGISEDKTIIVYDTTGLFSAARIWWMFRQFGAKRTYVLDGGFPAWKKAGFKTEKGIKKKTPTTFNAKLDDNLIIGLEEMKKAVLSEDGPLLLDARARGRFYGLDKEPRAGVKSGHMPGAVNLPFNVLLDEKRKLLPTATLQQIFDEKGFNPEKPTIATCGSGVTASVILMALAHLGYDNIPLYDASWSEWGALDDVPVVTSD